MQLKPHQEKFAHNYNGKNLIVHEGGTGKTICACVWLRDGRDNDALVICPKRVVKKWEETLTSWGTKATVLSKEQFKKTPLRQYSAIVVDEADEFASPLFVAKLRSQLSTSLYNLIRLYKAPILLLTATPIRSTPWNLHTLLCFSGKYIDYRLWQKEFFVLEKRPFIGKKKDKKIKSSFAYFPKNNWRKRIRVVLEKYADIVLMRNIVDMPVLTEKIINVETPPFVPVSWEDTSNFHDEMRWEQQNKLQAIKEIAKEFRKVLVVVYYREQIEELSKELSKERETFTVYGGVKNQEELLQAAQESDECYLIVQAGLGAGFDADTFSCVIFASMSYSVRDWVQMEWRVTRIHNLHPVIYYYLIGGQCDKQVRDTVMLGKDFVPSKWKEYGTPRLTQKTK